MDAALKTRILACPTLPSLPAAALEAARLCCAAELDPWALADALSSDQALAGRVLRAANASPGAARGRAGTLTRAVPLLGTRAIAAIALSSALARGRRRDDDGFDREACWRRAVLSAIASRTLAEGVGPVVDPEEAFLAALLQDVGVLALAEVFPSYGALCARAGGDHEALAALEREAFETDHAAVGALLADAWHVPPALCRAVAGSHGAPRRDAPAAEACLLRCVIRSRPLAEVWTAKGEGARRAALEAAQGQLGVVDLELEGLLYRMGQLVLEAEGDLDIDLGGAEQVAAVQAESRRLPAALELGPVAGEAGAKVERGEALEGALRLAFTRGHARGEPVALLEVAPDLPLPAAPSTALVALLRRCLRATDLVGPIDGGRVLLLLPEADLAAATAVAGRLLARISAGGPRLSLSIGVAAAPGSASSLDQLRAAAAAGAIAAHARGGSQVATGLDARAGAKA